MTHGYQENCTMPDTEILTVIDCLADLAADVAATRGWLARVQCGYEIGPRERAAISRHIISLRDNAAAAVHGARLLGLAPPLDSREPLRRERAPRASYQ